MCGADSGTKVIVKRELSAIGYGASSTPAADMYRVTALKYLRCTSRKRVRVRACTYLHFSVAFQLERKEIYIFGCNLAVLLPSTFDSQ